jgi:hypothetical protein
MPGVGARVGGAVAASGLFGFWANPAGGAAFGWAAAGVLADGELAGACAAAGVSQAAAKAIAHPILFISTPDHMLEPKTQVRAAGIARSIGAAFGSLKRQKL